MSLFQSLDRFCKCLENFEKIIVSNIFCSSELKKRKSNISGSPFCNAGFMHLHRLRGAIVALALELATSVVGHPVIHLNTCQACSSHKHVMLLYVWVWGGGMRRNPFCKNVSLPCWQDCRTSDVYICGILVWVVLLRRFIVLIQWIFVQGVGASRTFSGGHDFGQGLDGQCFVVIRWMMHPCYGRKPAMLIRFIKSTFYKKAQIIQKLRHWLMTHWGISQSSSVSSSCVSHGDGGGGRKIMWDSTRWAATTLLQKSPNRQGLWCHFWTRPL